MRLGGTAGPLMLAVALAGCAAVSNALQEPDVKLERVLVRDVGVRGGERSGVFLSSASPVQLTNAVGMTSVVPFDITSSQGGLVGSHAV